MVDNSGIFRESSETWNLKTMSPSASVALEFLGVQNASETNGTVLNGSSHLKFGPRKHLAKLRFAQELSRIKPHMTQKVLSSIEASEEMNADLTHVNRQVEGFNGISEASSQTEMLELFPVSISSGSGSGSNPRVTENKITFPSAINPRNPDSRRSVTEKAPEEQSAAQLAIFYNGAMNVYDVTAEKAEAIMKLASANSSSSTTSTITSSKIENISKPLPSKPSSFAVNENQPQRLPVDLEIVQKLSLQRFRRD